MTSVQFQLFTGSCILPLTVQLSPNRSILRLLIGPIPDALTLAGPRHWVLARQAASLLMVLLAPFPSSTLYRLAYCNAHPSHAPAAVRFTISIACTRSRFNATQPPVHFLRLASLLGEQRATASPRHSTTGHRAPGAEQGKATKQNKRTNRKFTFPSSPYHTLTLHRPCPTSTLARPRVSRSPVRSRPSPIPLSGRDKQYLPSLLRYSIKPKLLPPATHTLQSILQPRHHHLSPTPTPASPERNSFL